MPIFEYKCEDCGKKVEMLIRSSSDQPVCECGSKNLKKLFSAFAVSEKSSSCASGSCGLPAAGPSPCSSGMCGL